jgi:hypothetical protein
MEWFSVDRKGLAQLLERKGKSFVLFELIQNAWDEKSSRVDVSLTRIPSTRFVRLVVEDDNADGFALSVDTPIPTPVGWSTMESIQVGDMIYDECGHIQYVTDKTKSFVTKEAYEVVFDNGEVIIADANHLWTVTTDNQRAKGLPATTLNTAKMAVMQAKRNQGYSPGIQPVLSAPELPLPLDPYLLGYWLGDGTKGTGAIACAASDADYVRAMGEDAGFRASREASRTIYFLGLMPILKILGVVDHKHIPAAYMRAGPEARLALLRGLADSDGSSKTDNRRSNFYNTNTSLIAGFMELVWSLGGVCSVRVNCRADLPGQPARRQLNGRPVRQNHDMFAVSFAVPGGGHRMPRKASCQWVATNRQRLRTIRYIRPAADQIVQCLSTSAISGLFLGGKSMVATHNCDLSHAFTLFAQSAKKTDATARGRFNLGEKLVLALCEEATIASTRGTIIFDPDGRRASRAKRPAGSCFTARLKMTDEELRQCHEAVGKLLPPPGIETRYNGDLLTCATPLASARATLTTETADAEGVLRRSQRQTELRWFEPQEGHEAMLYEMGIPVVETGDRWSVDIQQKIPLNFDRDNVTPAYLARIRALTLDTMSKLLSTEDANASWARQAIQSHGDELSLETIDRMAELRFGAKRVAYDPSDIEANHLAVAQGYTVVHGAQMSKSEWAANRRASSILPAGQVTPSPRPYSADGDPLKVVSQDKWTPAMKNVVDYIQRLAPRLLDLKPGTNVHVTIASDIAWPFAATYGTLSLTLNLGRLGHAWFQGPLEKINDLLLHEFGHHYASNHLSSDYYEALTRLGARLTALALEDATLFELRPPVECAA